MNEEKEIKNLEELILTLRYSEKSLTTIRDEYINNYKHKPKTEYFANYRYQLDTMFKTLYYGRDE